MCEYAYKIDGYNIGVRKSKENDEIALTIIKSVEDGELVVGSFHGNMSRFIDLILKENIMLKQNSIPKQIIEQKIQNLNDTIITLENKYYKCKDLEEKQINIEIQEKTYDEIEILEKLVKEEYNTYEYGKKSK